MYISYSIEDIERAQRIARYHNLKGSAMFCSMAPARLKACCNGIGADWMPELARLVISMRYQHMLIPAMIHDMEFDYADGTEQTFHKANAHFRDNGYTMAKVTYKWYNPLRYTAMFDSYKLYKILELTAWPAYQSAVESRRSEK